jgi:hypothetical protein
MTLLTTREALAKADEAMAAWEQKGPTSLTVALLAEALYGLRGAVVDAATLADVVRRWQRTEMSDASAMAEIAAALSEPVETREAAR